MSTGIDDAIASLTRFQDQDASRVAGKIAEEYDLLPDHLQFGAFVNHTPPGGQFA